MNEQSLLARRRWLVLASAVLSFFAVGITFFAVPPLVPELTIRFGLNHLQIGVLMGAISIPAILLSIPLGAAIDHWPPRATGNVGLTLMVIGGVLFAVSPVYAGLLVGRFLFGVGGLVINILLGRLISTAFAGRELSFAMGIFSSVYPASMIVIFSCHTPLLHGIGWRNELLLLSAAVVLAFPLHNLAVPSRKAAAADQPIVSSLERPRVSRPLAALAGTWMLFFVAFAPVLTFAPEWAGGDQAALLTVTAVMWVALFLSPVVGKLIDRLAHAELWATGGQFLLALVLVAMASAWLQPLTAMLLVGLVAAIVPTAIYSLPARLVPPSQVGFAFGFITAFSNLGTLAGPAAAGAIRDMTGTWLMAWLLLAGAATVGAVISFAARTGKVVAGR